MRLQFNSATFGWFQSEAGGSGRISAGRRFMIASLAGWLLWQGAPGFAQETDVTPRVLKSLEPREEQQAAAARQCQAFYDFQFQDLLAPSGITFTNHAVDDASRNYKAVHYDHGTGMAVAD